MSRKSLVRTAVAVGLAFTAGVAAAAPSSHDALILRGWQPYLTLAHDAGPGQEVCLLRRGLLLPHNLLMNTKLDKATRQLSDTFWSSLKDFDLGQLYELLPNKEGSWRSLTLVGKLKPDEYLVRQPAGGAESLPLKMFGQMRFRAKMRPKEDPRGDVYNIHQRFKIDFGPVQWPSVLKALRIGLRQVSRPAPLPVSNTIAGKADAMGPELSAPEKKVLAQLWTAFPTTFAWYASIGTVRDLQILDDAASGAHHLHVTLQLKQEAMETRYPKVFDYLQRLGDLLTAHLVIESTQGRWLSASLDSKAMRVTLDAWVKNGHLVPVRNGRPRVKTVEAGFADRMTWHSRLDLRVRALGVTVNLDDMSGVWKYRRETTGARFEGHIYDRPKVQVDGLALGFFPATWFDSLSPVNITGTINDFMDVLVNSNHGSGARFVITYGRSQGKDNVLSVLADLDALDNFFVHFAVSMVSGRVVPGGDQADGLRQFVNDAVMAADQDVGGLKTVLAQTGHTVPAQCDPTAPLSKSTP